MLEVEFHYKRVSLPLNDQPDTLQTATWFETRMQPKSFINAPGKVRISCILNPWNPEPTRMEKETLYQSCHFILMRLWGSIGHVLLPPQHSLFHRRTLSHFMNKKSRHFVLIAVKKNPHHVFIYLFPPKNVSFKRKNYTSSSSPPFFFLFSFLSCQPTLLLPLLFLSFFLISPEGFSSSISSASASASRVSQKGCHPPYMCVVLAHVCMSVCEPEALRLLCVYSL